MIHMTKMGIKFSNFFIQSIMILLMLKMIISIFVVVGTFSFTMLKKLFLVSFAIMTFSITMLISITGNNNIRSTKLKM